MPKYSILLNVHLKVRVNQVWKVNGAKLLPATTRTTRTPAFWGYPPPPHDCPYYWPVHIGSQVKSIDQFILDSKSKQDKVKFTNLKNLPKLQIFTPQPSGLEGYCRHGPGGRAGGRAGGCQTCGTHISVTARWIFSVRSSMELSRPVVVHCHAHLPICPIWACPWAKNLSNLPQLGSRLCGSHISKTAGWIYPI